MTRRVSAAELGLGWEATYELRGGIPPAPRVAVVGSRACSRAGARATWAVVEAAGQSGWSLVSGGALGIDANAHAAALDGALPQLAVLPCGPDRPYPPDNRWLFDRIARRPGCGVLFGQPTGRRPTRGMFASRNRVVVGLARALIVVEAAARSGSAGTGRLALAMGIPTAVVPGSRGCTLLAAEGGYALRERGSGTLVDAARDWLDGVLQGKPALDAAPPWPRALQWLRDAMQAQGGRGISVEDLSDPLAGIVALTEAEAKGLVQEVAPGRYLPR